MVKWLHDKFLICHFQVNSLNFFRQFVGRMERICIRFNIFDKKNVSSAFFFVWKYTKFNLLIDVEGT